MTGQYILSSLFRNCCMLLVILLLVSVKLAWALVFNFTLKMSFEKEVQGYWNFLLCLSLFLVLLAKQLVCVCRGWVWAAIVHGCNGATVCDQKSKNGLLSSESQNSVGGVVGRNLLYCLHSSGEVALWKRSRAVWMGGENYSVVTFRKLP